MAGEALATTIFRFVTVRNPRRATSDELDTGFAHYDAQLQAGLVKQVSDAKANAKTKREAMRTAILAFVKTSSYLRTRAALYERDAALVDWADWLGEHASGIKAADIAAQLHAHPLEIGKAEQALLWDNLVAYTFGGGNPEVRELVQWCLRAINIAKYGEIPDDATAQRLARATVVLPSAVQVNPEHTHTKTEQPPEVQQPSKKDVEKANRQVQAYQQAHDELTSLYRTQVEQARTEDMRPPATPHVDTAGKSHAPKSPPPAPSARDVGVLSESTHGDLTEHTRGVLGQIKAAPGLRLPFVLQSLEKAAAKQGAAVWSTGKASTMMVKAGGAYWSPEDLSSQNHVPPKIPPGRVDVEYDGMYDADTCRVKPLGIADFRRVEQTIWCYEPGEVAHIENILKGEGKERSTRMLRRTEDTLTTTTEEDTTKERDTQTTDRYEIEKESDKIVKDDINFALGVQVTASYGTVQIHADTNFALAHSTSDSDKTSSKYAKEVTDRAMESVTKKLQTQQIQKIIDEYEEINKHTLDNTNGTEHIVGLYRWVDKIYQAKIVNYGKRLMFEFLVPEPAAFHLYALTQAPPENGLTLEKPIDPRSPDITQKLGVAPLTGYTDINAANFGFWASAYDAKVDPAPPYYQTISKAYNRDGIDQGTEFSDSKNDLKLPEGYEATTFNCSYGLHSEGDNWITVMIGRDQRFTSVGGTFSGVLNGEDDFIPICIMGKTKFYALAIEATCTRTDETYEAWQIKTFDSIIKGYDDKMAAYETALDQAKSQTGSIITGTNPDQNRQTEQLELKKGCIRLLDPYCQPLWSNAVTDNSPPCGYPEFDCCTAISDANYVQFVEQAFEWDLITYLFYPYFWGRKCNWQKIYLLKDEDPLFLNFLQAGFARVVVPVRPGYEDAVLRFIVDGQPWNGGTAPGVDSELYLSIANEMKEPVGTVDPTVEPWFVRVPTTLTVLQCDSGCVPGTGLPCPSGADENP